MFNTGKVVQLAGYRRGVHSAEIQQMRAYWEALRPEGGLPTREQINPRGIEGILEKTFLLERIAPGIARLRLAGMHLNELMGIEVRGMPLSSMMMPNIRDRFAAVLEKVFAEPAALTLTLEADRGIMRPALSAQMLILPLQDEQGVVTRALGCLITEGKIGRAPRRFVVSSTKVEPITIGARATCPSVTRPRVEGFAEAPTPMKSVHGTAKPKLRLILSEESK